MVNYLKKIKLLRKLPKLVHKVSPQLFFLRFQKFIYMIHIFNPKYYFINPGVV